MSRSPLVWIDMLNSPQVLFFRPLITELRRRGCRTTVTVRDFAQTRAMCELYEIEHTVIGVHGGASLIGKGTNLLARVRQLNAYAARVRPDAVLTHNSYSQLIAARMRLLPSVTSMDYEHQPANHLAFRCATAVFVPRAFPDEALRRLGARPSKVWKYPGIKEEISLAGFVPTPGYRQSLGVDDDSILVVVRPPARFALYHRFENPLFVRLLLRLRDEPGARVIVMPRTEEQARELEAAGLRDLVWRGEVLNGPDLIAAADLVVTAGGSMAREAAVLGTPACSVYAGKMAVIDLQLEREGRLVIVRSEDDVAELRVTKKTAEPLQVVGGALVGDFIDHAVAAWRARRRYD